MNMTTPEMSIELLESTHEFPGPYTIKVFGPHNQEFLDRVRDTTKAVLMGGAFDLTFRASSRGTHGCATVEAQVEDAQQVILLYGELANIDGVRMIL
jgi:putative lipoic acid-binding regulatory protein